MLSRLAQWLDLGGPGLDLITDVDDTIKVTNVSDRPDSARNTFLRPFQSVPGIASKLAAWAAAHRCQVHFREVSELPALLL